MKKIAGALLEKAPWICIHMRLHNEQCANMNEHLPIFLLGSLITYMNGAPELFFMFEHANVPLSFSHQGIVNSTIGESTSARRSINRSTAMICGWLA